MDKSLAIKITSMDESLRCKGVIGEYNGFRIISDIWPRIDEKTLFVRGNDESFDNVGDGSMLWRK